MSPETKAGIFKLVLIVTFACIFIVVIAGAVTGGVWLAQYVDPQHGWIWSFIFWGALFGSIVGMTLLFKRLTG